jgi:ferredoxin-NADP reductase
LLYSVRHPGAVWYRDELQARSADDRAIGVTYNYTRAAPLNWPRPPGRIDAELVAASAWPPTLSPTCYVCGPTSFVEHVAGLLTALGHLPDRIRTERFGPTSGGR